MTALHSFESWKTSQRLYLKGRASDGEGSRWLWQYRIIITITATGEGGLYYGRSYDEILFKESNMLALHAMHGHFATSHSHINYYVDVTSIKTRVAEAKQAAHVLYSRIPKTKYVDTIVCMDGTEVVGTFLTEEIQRDGIMGTTNQHETVYVISPEINSNNQMLFRDNNKAAINGNMLCFF